MRRFAFVTIPVLLVCSVVLSQKPGKPWAEWTRKEVDKMLNDSAWGQTQTEYADPSRTSGSTITQTTAGASLNRDPARDINTRPDPMVRYCVRFLSAKPIRQAIARNMLLELTAPNPQLEERLKQFVDAAASENIIITVTLESNDRALGNSADQALKAATTEALAPVTYIERKDGQRVLLAEYRAPGRDGLGARFLFPRMLNGKPFVDANAGQVRFYSELSKKIKLSLKFKASEMVYDGQVEY